MSEFNPYAAPETDLTMRASGEPGEGLWRDGGELVCSKTAAFPDRCIKCNEFCGEYRLKRQLRWHSPTYFLLLLISPIIYLIVALFVWKKAKLAFPLCERHRRKRLIAIAVGCLLPMFGIVLMPLGIGAAANAGDNRGTIETASLIAGFALIVGGIVYGSFVGRIASVKMIDDRFVRLASVSRKFLAPLPDFQDRYFR